MGLMCRVSNSSRAFEKPLSKPLDSALGQLPYVKIGELAAALVKSEKELSIEI